MKNTSKFLIVFLIVFGMTACGDDFLDRPPILEESRELVLQSFTGMNNATIGLYAEFYHSAWYGAAFPIITDLKGDNSKSSPLSSGRYQQNYNWNQDPSQTMGGLWFRAYRAITSASNIINAAPDVDLLPGQQEAWVDHLVAEAKFVRALAHFDLVRVFAQPYTYQPNSLGVPVITVTRIGTPARNTVAEVYEQIESDLTDAIAMFSENATAFYNTHRSGTVNPKGFSSRDAARALMARVKLYKGDYAAAAQYATQVIDAGYTLYTADNWMDAWGTDGASEIVFEIFGSTGNGNWPSWEEIGYLYHPGGGYGDVCATNAHLALYEPSDVRLGIFVEPANQQGFFWPSNKYPGKNDPNKRDNNIPVLRLSEMYLIRAEARLNGATGSAADDLNAIRTRRGLDAISNPTMDDIFDERRRELAFEGHILFDYARLGRTLEREDEDNRLTGPTTIPFPSHLWAMPIPIGEMEANPNMEQNPGY